MLNLSNINLEVFKYVQVVYSAQYLQKFIILLNCCACLYLLKSVIYQPNGFTYPCLILIIQNLFHYEQCIRVILRSLKFWLKVQPPPPTLLLDAFGQLYR